MQHSPDPRGGTRYGHCKRSLPVHTIGDCELNRQVHHVQRRLLLLIPLFGMLLVSACAPTRPTVDHLGLATDALQEAADAGAAQHAPLDFSNAERRLVSAEVASVGGDFKRADLLARESLAAAQLAGAKARLESRRIEVETLRGHNEQLRRELGPAADGIGRQTP